MSHFTKECDIIFIEMEYTRIIKVLSLEEPFYVDEFGGMLTLADVIPSEEDVAEQACNRALIDSLPPQIVKIGEKIVDGRSSTAAERKKLQRFRENERRNNPNG